MKDKFVDYYEILGISPDASQEEIKKAFRRKIKENHPDKFQKESTEKKIKAHKKTEAILKAYQVLSNIETRKKYDEQYKIYTARKNKQEEEQATESYEEYVKRRRPEREETFADIFARAYREVRKEERRNNFYRRHRTINRNFYKNNSYGYTIPEEAIFHMKQGTVHIFGELFYQLSKLTYIRKDSFPKYIIRNRSLIGLTLVGYIFVNSLTGQPTSEVLMPKETISTHTEYDNTTTSYSDYIVMNRDYTIQYGDTLSEIAENAGIYVSTLKRENNLTSDMIYWKDKIVVPYRIKEEDLAYYTEVISTNGESIFDIANEYETDVETLIMLNREAIEKDGNTYFILSDEIVVPNFITKEELQNRKSPGYNKKYM